MRLGAILTGLSPGRQRPVASWARQLVAAGFESLWMPQLIGRGVLVPDPFVSLAAAAVATGTDGPTSGVELGTATVQVPLHHPADLAHRVLSLRQICGDRLTLGVSPGSTAVDYATLDRDFPARFRQLRQDLPRLRELLAQGGDPAADLAPPELAGLPPLLLGSWGVNVERAAREFDGWLASDLRRTPEEIIEALHRFRAAGGRRAVVSAIRVAGPGDLGPTRDRLERYADAGFDDAIIVIEPDGPTPERVRGLLNR